MVIEIWSDFVCPFCFIGEEKLEIAIDKLGFRDKVKIKFKSYELDPDIKPYCGESFKSLIMNKYGMTEEQADFNNENITSMAREVGLDFKMELLKPTNTFKAHRLCRYGLSKGISIVKPLFRAYFEKGLNLSDNEVLLDIAEQNGLDREESLKVLNDDNSFAPEVRHDEDEAIGYGIDAVPYFLFNGKYVVKGAHSVDMFVSALKHAYEDKYPPED